MDILPTAFAALAAYPHFIVYVLRPRVDSPGKTDKVPIDPRTLKNIKPNVPSAWMTADQAIIASQLLGAQYGVGYVLTPSDPFWFLDIDNCVDNDTCDWTPLAKNLYAYFAGAAVEVSSSGKGLHIIGSGKAPAHACKNIALNIEFYTENRFIALTGLSASGDAAKDFTPQLPWLVETYFTKKINVEFGKDWTDEPSEDWAGPDDDAELIRRALRSNSARAIFGDKLTFKDLWEANVDALAAVYPPQGGGAYDASSADIVLAMQLAFWTGNNCERIERLMWESNLVRDKWNRRDYMIDTILKACAATTNFYKEPARTVTPVAAAHTSAVNSVPAGGYLSIEEQQSLFTGCVYVQDAHKIFIPGGVLLKSDQFQATFGGYTFPLDAENQKTTRNPWEAFTQSQVSPMRVNGRLVNSTCFRPDLIPGEIIEKDGRRLINIFWPIHTPRKSGDASLFTQHIAKLIPDERDQIILISYLAACVQYKGVKFKWCPFIQGVDGNGKTVLTDCVRFAIGDRYVHSPTAAEIAEKYNDWMYGSLVIGIEDVFIKDSDKDVMERLKPMITSERLEIRAMHTNKTMREICCNFILNSNHKDGIRKGRNDRRFAPFYTMQQKKEDLIRDGMTSEYFIRLFRWLEQEDGFAIVSDFLHTYPIPDEFNPALKGIAPITTSTHEAVGHGSSNIEQEIEEAIELGEIGFRGGWVSSFYLNALLERLRATRYVCLNARRELMNRLGYDWHPILTRGRVNNAVLPENVKSKLFVKDDHPARGISCASEVARAYTAAQGSII